MSKLLFRPKQASGLCAHKQICLKSYTSADHYNPLKLCPVCSVFRDHITYAVTLHSGKIMHTAGSINTWADNVWLLSI